MDYSAFLLAEWSMVQVFRWQAGISASNESISRSLWKSKCSWQFW